MKFLLGTDPVLDREEYDLDESQVVTLLFEDEAYEPDAGDALVQASERGDDAVVERLIAAGADVDADNGHAFIAAAKNGHDAVVDRFIAAGADVYPLHNNAVYNQLYGDDAVADRLRAVADRVDDEHFIAGRIAAGYDVHTLYDEASEAFLHGDVAFYKRLRAAGDRVAGQA